jgi:glycosyltransferase involved in cell wall biosynthesis
MISIIIPAHNEARVIRRCLERVIDGLKPGEAEVIVACNGCSDDTAQIARAFGGPVRVIETTIPSKVNALNLGDEAAVGFPRVYMDADIRLDGRSIRRLAEVLEQGPYLAAAPSMGMDLDRSSWFVRAYYRIWSALPYTREGFMGVGTYAMSEAGRRRLGRLP